MQHTCRRYIKSEDFCDTFLILVTVNHPVLYSALIALSETWVDVWCSRMISMHSIVLYIPKMT